MDTPSVRAKFKVTDVTPIDDGFKVKLSTVVEGSEENVGFFKMTPAGFVTLEVVNAETGKLFVKGKQYFVDFTPAEELDVVASDQSTAPAEAISTPAEPAATAPTENAAPLDEASATTPTE